MAEITKIIPLELAPAIATYNYTDIAEGTGVVTFLGFESRISGTVIKQHLGTNAIYSSEIESSSSAAASPNVSIFDLSPFNLPKTMKGTAIIRFSGGIDAVAAGTYVFYHIELIKVKADLSTVPIADVDSDEIEGNSSVDQRRSFVLPVTIPQTHFKSGEFLRVIATMYVRGSTGIAFIGHDPANRDGVFLTPAADWPTKFEVYMPFRLDS